MNFIDSSHFRSTPKRESAPMLESFSLRAARKKKAESQGNGPVDATVKAIESVVGSGAELLLFSVNSISSGTTESQGEVTMRLTRAGRIVNGVGADPDIVVASAKAYLNALNKLQSRNERVNPQP